MYRGSGGRFRRSLLKGPRGRLWPPTFRERRGRSCRGGRSDNVTGGPPWRSLLGCREIVDNKSCRSTVVRALRLLILTPLPHRRAELRRALARHGQLHPRGPFVLAAHTLWLEKVARNAHALRRRWGGKTRSGTRTSCRLSSGQPRQATLPFAECLQAFLLFITRRGREKSRAFRCGTWAFMPHSAFFDGA